MVGLYRNPDGENIAVTAVTTEQSYEVAELQQIINKQGWRIYELEQSLKQHTHVSVKAVFDGI